MLFAKMCPSAHSDSIVYAKCGWKEANINTSTATTTTTTITMTTTTTAMSLGWKCMELAFRKLSWCASGKENISGTRQTCTNAKILSKCKMLLLTIRSLSHSLSLCRPCNLASLSNVYRMPFAFWHYWRWWRWFIFCLFFVLMLALNIRNEDTAPPFADFLFISASQWRIFFCLHSLCASSSVNRKFIRI